MKMVKDNLGTYSRINSSALPPAVKSLNYLNNILAKIELRKWVIRKHMLNDKGEIECPEIMCLLF